MLVYLLLKFFHFCPLEPLSVDSCAPLTLSVYGYLGGGTSSLSVVTRYSDLVYILAQY